MFLSSAGSEAAVAVAIGMGSNVGDPIEHLRAGARELVGFLADPRFSSVFRTEPLHRADQPRFLNACCVGRVRLAPEQLLARLQGIERGRGRRPGPRYGPRELDLDILLYGSQVVESDRLRIPHPRMTERAFVLVPLREVAGEWTHPTTGLRIRELADRVDAAGVEATNLQLGGDRSG